GGWLTEPDEELISARSQLRQRRQQRLGEDPALTLHSIVHENVLHTLVGDAEIMLQQLDHLLTKSAQLNITLQVVPANTGAYPGMGIAYNVITFNDNETPAVYLDNLTDGI